MPYKSNISYGKEIDIIPNREISNILDKINNLIFTENDLLIEELNKNIIFDKNSKIVYVEDISKIINLDNFILYLERVLDKIVYKPEDYHLSSKELHIRWKNCNVIPPHQDNFYHCFSSEESFKVLVPLTNASKDSGYLNWAKVSHNQIVLRHAASSIEAFSSYIPSSELVDLPIQWNSFVLHPGDISWHSINSIHFANSNKIQSECIFLVFRFDHKSINIDQSMNLEYKKVFEQHKSILNS
tara:strand:+ start:73307 stop:74032 length:726 start_codon:yes stop_codon:yes gene_type:complete